MLGCLSLSSCPSLHTLHTASPWGFPSELHHPITFCLQKRPQRISYKATKQSPNEPVSRAPNFPHQARQLASRTADQRGSSEQQLKAITSLDAQGRGAVGPAGFAARSWLGSSIAIQCVPRPLLSACECSVQPGLACQPCSWSVGLLQGSAGLLANKSVTAAPDCV